MGRGIRSAMTYQCASWSSCPVLRWWGRHAVSRPIVLAAVVAALVSLILATLLELVPLWGPAVVLLAPIASKLPGHGLLALGLRLGLPFNLTLHATLPFVKVRVFDQTSIYMRPCNCTHLSTVVGQLLDIKSTTFNPKKHLAKHVIYNCYRLLVGLFMGGAIRHPRIYTSEMPVGVK